MTKFGDKAYLRFKQKDTEDRLTKLFEDRIQKIEEVVFKNGKTPSSMAQQILLLNELGLLEVLKKLKLSDVKLAALLSVILNSNKDNIRKVLSKINMKDSDYKTSVNYAYLHTIYEAAKLTDLAAKADAEYTRLTDQEKKKIKIGKSLG